MKRSVFIVSIEAAVPVQRPRTSSMELVTALLPMFALTLVMKLRPGGWKEFTLVYNGCT
jgi:hypothetical protein